jgi:flavodoxin
MAVNFISSASYAAFNEFELSQPSVRLPTSYKILPALSAANNLRQGTEMRSSADIYNSTQPKIWAGEVSRDGTLIHGIEEVEIVGFGQPLSFTATYFNSNFTEQQIRFDPVAFVSNSSLYPFPIELNGGLPVQLNNVIEPFTIPFRLPSIESGYFAKGIHGTFDEGPDTDGLGRGNQVISQLVTYYDANEQTRPFYDEGQQIFGDLSGAIYFPGYETSQQRINAPFTEKPNNYDKSFLEIGNNATFTNAIETLDYTRDEDVRKTYVKKSAAAGRDVYGHNNGRLGTDSIAYNSRLRGS